MPLQFYINGFPATNPYPYDSVFTNLTSGIYVMSVIDANNCTDTSEIAIVHTVPLTEIFVPSSFTPNGDFHNELFEFENWTFLLSYKLC